MSGKYKQICWLLKPPEPWLPNISWHSHGTKPAVSAFQVRGQAALQMSDSLTHPPHTQNDTSTCRHTASEAQTTEWFSHPAKLSSQRAATNIAKNSLRINEFGRQGTIQRPCLVQAGTFYCKEAMGFAGPTKTLLEYGSESTIRHSICAAMCAHAGTTTFPSAVILCLSTSLRSEHSHLCMGTALPSFHGRL